MTNRILLIGTTGLLRVLYSDNPIDPFEYIPGEGTPISMSLTVDGQDGAQVHFRYTETSGHNLRAREVLASLTGVHVVLLDTVGFTGLPADRVSALVEQIG